MSRTIAHKERQEKITQKSYLGQRDNFSKSVMKNKIHGMIMDEEIEDMYFEPEIYDWEDDSDEIYTNGD